MRGIAFAALFSTLTGAATLAIANPPQLSPEARAYLSFGFGAPASSQQHFHYGLRLDHDSRLRDELPAPIAQMDFTRQGFNHLRVNGVPVAQTVYQTNQTDGNTISYSIIDWGALVLGVAGAGFLISEVADGEDDPEPAPAGGGDGGDDGGGDDGGGTPLGGTPLGGVPLGFAQLPGDGQLVEAREQQIWLDGGTGQMGDLYPSN